MAAGSRWPKRLPMRSALAGAAVRRSGEAKADEEQPKSRSTWLAVSEHLGLFSTQHDLNADNFITQPTSCFAMGAFGGGSRRFAVGVAGVRGHGPENRGAPLAVTLFESFA